MPPLTDRRGKAGVMAVQADPFVNSVDGGFMSVRQMILNATSEPVGAVSPTSSPPYVTDDAAATGNVVVGSASTTPSDATSQRFYTPEEEENSGDDSSDLGQSPTVGRQLQLDFEGDGDSNDDDRYPGERTGDVMYMPDLFFELFFDVRYLPYCHLSKGRGQLPPELIKDISTKPQLSRSTSESSCRSEGAVTAARVPSPVPLAGDDTGGDGADGSGDEVSPVEGCADAGDNDVDDAAGTGLDEEAGGMMKTPTRPSPSDDDGKMGSDPSPSQSSSDGSTNGGVVDGGHPGNRSKTRKTTASKVLRKIRKSLSPRKRIRRRKKGGSRTGGGADGDEVEVPQVSSTPTRAAVEDGAMDPQCPPSPGLVEKVASARTVTLSSPGPVDGSSSRDVNMNTVDLEVREDKPVPTRAGAITPETSVTSSNDTDSNDIGSESDNDAALQRSFIRVCDLNLSHKNGRDDVVAKRWCSISNPNDPDELSDVLERLSRNGLEYAAGASRSSPIRWKPTPDTDKFLRKSGRADDPVTLARDMERRGTVLVWSGTVNHDGYGREIPMAKARGIVRNATPKQLLDLLLDSGRVRAYNKMSLGREDVSFLQRGVHTVPSRLRGGAGVGGSLGGSTLSVPGEVKLVRSRSRIPVVNHQLELLNMIYARDVGEELMELECGCRGEAGVGNRGKTEAYLAVSRAVNDKLSWEAVTGGDGADDVVDDVDAAADGGSEMLFGVNLMRSVDGAEGEPKTDFTCVTHLNSSLVPVFLAKRMGLKSAANFIHDVQAYFEQPDD